MIIKQNREALDTNLKDPNATVFLLIGQENSKAEEVHDLIETKNWDEWHHWLLITDISLLTDGEKQAWFQGNVSDYYAVLGGDKLPKKVAKQGPVTDLFNSNNKPGYIKIRDAFLMGDEA